MKKLVKESARRLGVDLAVRSFPKSLGDGVGAIEKDARTVYPSRREIKSALNSKQEDAGRIFLSIFKRSPEKAIAYANKIGVAINLEKKVDEGLVKSSIRMINAWSGARGSRKVSQPYPFRMLVDRDAAIEKHSKRMAKRVGTAAGGWVEASKFFGPLRYDGKGAKLEKFKRARRPMIVGRGELLPNGPRHEALLINTVEYADKCIGTEAFATAVRFEIKNLEKQADAVINRRAGREIASANA